MLCERCNEKEATIHYTELVNGVRSEHHICSECASKLMPAEYGSMFGADMPFAKFLTGLFAAGRADAGTADDTMAHNDFLRIYTGCHVRGCRVLYCFRTSYRR